MSFDKHLRHTARCLRNHNVNGELPSTELRERVLGALPSMQDNTERRRRARFDTKRVAPKVAVMIAVSGLVAAILVSAPRVKPASAAEVRAAVAQAATWHLSGWRRRADKKVHWEVWGRRNPFFYREQVGDEILIDDGITRTYILPATPQDGWREPQPGIILKQPSSRVVTFALTDPRAGFLVGIQGDANNLHPVTPGVLEGKQIYLGTNYTEETARLTIDPRTRLPHHYVVRRTESKPEGTPGKDMNWDSRTPLRDYPTAELTATYNIALPSRIAVFDTPQSSVAVIDLREPCRDPAAHGPETGSKGGLTLKGKVVGQDASGNMLLRFRSWLGNVPYNHRSMPLSLAMNRSPGEAIAVDEAGRAFFLVSDSGSFNSQNPELWLAPDEPFTRNMSRPRQLTVHLTVSLNRYERIGNSGRGVPVVSEPVALTVPLPADVAPLDYDAPQRWEGYTGPRPTFAETIAANRAEFYLHGQLSAQGKRVRNYERASYWWEIASKEAARCGDTRGAEIYRKNAQTRRHR